MTFTSKRFEVKSNPWSGIGEPNLSNLSDLFRPGDEDRLKWMYSQYGPQASFDPRTRQFFPGNLGQYGAPPNYGGELDGSPGDAYNLGGGSPFQVPIPRISPIDESQFGGSNGCPSGFYQFGKVCVPDTSLNPNSVGSELGQGGFFDGSFYGKGGPKGVISAVTPPQFTQANQEFIVITDMQNIGGQPAKFMTSIDIPELGISGDVSNSTLVNPLSKMKIGHRIIMPATAAVNKLFTANVKLIKIPLTNTPLDAGPPANPGGTLDDSGQVSIPSPGFRGPVPPAGGGIAGTIGAGQGLYPGPPPIFPQPPQQPYPFFGPPQFQPIRIGLQRPTGTIIGIGF